MADGSSLAALTQSPAPGAAAPGSAPSATPQGPGISNLVRPPPGAQPMPAPTHEQVASGLRHLHEIARHMKGILADPDIGKKNIRPKVFDAAAEMLGDGLLSMPEIMNQIKTLPVEPAQQKQWVEKHYNDAMAAQGQLLEHHAAAFPGSGDFATDWGAERGKGAHGDNMKGLMGHYGGG
jgi:hypothetical protein